MSLKEGVLEKRMLPVPEVQA
uniref:Uncharacterized protein n=1 Tax=Anguilla anguilla TaxID=7936 RepID=A0A0E9TLF9_ANGAN